MQIRDYRDADEPSWLRCRALSFLGSSYYDDVKPAKTRFDGEAIQLVAVAPKPEHVQTPGDEQVVGIVDVELWQDDDGAHLATIDTIAVHPDQLRRGIADALLAEGLRRLAATPATVLDAWTRADEAANAWYVRHGFRIAEEYLHVHTDHDEADGFTSPEGLSRPIKAFCHASLDHADDLRARYARVHRCRRYVRPVRIVVWPESPENVATYDEENGDRDDLRFVAGLAGRLGAQRIADLGCGTGILAIDLARAGHAVTGIDPGKAILDIARTRAGSDPVTWVHGTARDLVDDDADLVAMTAHVANYFLTRTEWEQTLADIHRTLRRGGHLVFDSWNPGARVWTRWDEVRAVHESADGDVVETHGSHSEVNPTNAGAVVQETLRHWSAAYLRDSFARAGFTVVEQWGGYDGSAARDDSVQFIILACRD